MKASQLRAVFLGMAALLLMLALASPAHAAITATITHIDGNADNLAFPPYFRYANDGNLTIDFNVGGAGNNYPKADLYYSRAKKAFTNLIFDDLNLAGNKLVSTLKGYWRFDNNSLFDYSGLGNNGTSSASYNPAGKYGGGFDVDADKNVQIADSSSLDLGSAVSAMAWVYFNSTFADANIITKGTNYALTLSDGKIKFTVATGEATRTLSSDGNVLTGRWYHIAASLTAGSGSDIIRIMINGDLNTSQSWIANTAGDISTNDINLVIGGINGAIDEAHIFDFVMIDSRLYYDANNTYFNICQDLNFADSTRCRWDFNSMSVPDGNYFLDANAWATIDSNAADSSDNNFQLWQNPSIDVNITFLDGFSDANAGNRFSYARDSNITINFNVSVVSGVWQSPKVDINYSTGRLDFNTVIMRNIDLLQAGRCDDTNFLDSTKCSWDWNIHNSLMADGNYFVDINFYDDIFMDANSTDYNFKVDNTAPIIWTDYNRGWQNTDANIVAYEYYDVNFEIAATNDDCYATGTTATCNSVQAWGDATSLGIADINGYYRWALNIPKGSKIVSARIDEKAFANCGSAPYTAYCNSTGYTVKIELMAADNQGAFNSGSPWDVATAASVDYALTQAWAAGTWYSSPDINALVQSYINRAGYSSGNYMGLRFSHNNVADSKAKFADSFDSSSAPARLYVTYAAPVMANAEIYSEYRKDSSDANTSSLSSWTRGDNNILYFEDGNWAWQFRLKDIAGNTSDANAGYALVQKVLSITSPQSGAIFSNPNVTMTYTSKDPAEVTTYWVRADSGNWINNSRATSYAFTNLTSGTHTLYVKSNLGDVNSEAVGVSITINLGPGAATCGDGVCGSGETAISCAADCPPVCGDNACTHIETPDTCPGDCALGCGDRVCDPDAGETCSSCAADCGACPEEELPAPTVEKVLEQTQTGQATAQQIEDVLRDAGFTVSEIEAAKEASAKMSIARTISVEKKASEEGAPEDYESRITLAVTNTTSSALKNVRIVEAIPKSVANTTDEVISSRPFAVLKSDPVIQFSISEIPAGGTAEVKYSLAKKLTEEQIADYMPAVPAYAVEAAEARCELIRCDDKNPCTDDLCFDGECAYVYAKDGATCGFGRECAQGVCRGLALSKSIAGGFGFDMQTILAIVVVLAGVAVAAGIYIRKRR